MKEMEYKSLQEPEILDAGEYGGRHYVILNLGTHPTAYVEARHRKEDYMGCKIKVDVHGGLTFYGRAGWDATDSRTYIGWDYAHWPDRIGSFKGRREWTTAEILAEVKRAIGQLNWQEG